MRTLRVSLRAAVTTLVAILLSGFLVPGAWGAPDDLEFSWELTPTGSAARLRGLDALGPNVAWASGSEGTVLRTTDGGATWDSVGPPGTEALQFRDIEAFDDMTASILSIGVGPDSRIYKTVDGGATWTLTFQNEEDAAFYDCMAFFDRRHGLALSDPVDGKFRIVATDDGGDSWHIVPDAGMPPALEGEFAFAASGTCLIAGPGRNAWFATGGGAEARVFHSTDRGMTWSVTSTPIPSSPSAGIFSVAFATVNHGLAVGGDFLAEDVAVDALALSSDGGASWELVPDDVAPGGYRSGSAWIPGLSRTAIVVGPSGSDVSVDGGRTWSLFDDGSFDSVDCGQRGGCWASGEAGRVARLVVERAP
jgi:photosystem II stability/assembly factor-like uncharacterized protein